jgi:hypothetical protein
MDFTGELEDTFRCCGFTRVNVRKDTNVSVMA